MQNIKIAKIGKSPAVTYAQDELFRVLKKMDRRLMIDLRSFDEYKPEMTDTIWLGLCGKVEENSLDDEILIDVKNGAGVITGANERAVLIAAYRFLRELGCRWIRPGEGGEVVPKKAIITAELNVFISEKPSVRYRGIVIEGASHYEHIYNMIEWLPRVSMNSYYFQFWSADCFFKAWYERAHNPFGGGEEYTFAESLGNKAKIFEEVDRRGLIMVGPGHGFTTFPFGIFERSVPEDDPRITPEMKACMAEINGKRDVFERGGIKNTQLCYSNPRVRDLMTDYAVKYCKDHPSVGLLRFSLADGMNNHCECENCRQMRPSDWLMTMLNELDAKLTAEGIDTKVGFSAYVDTTWPPEKVKLNNPDRFIFNLSPSSRTYSKPLYELDCDPDTLELPEYERNNIDIPYDVEHIIAFYRKWRKWLGTPATIFDYPLMYEHFLDPGYMGMSRVIYKDVTGLEKLDFCGYFSCQENRCSFPTNMPDYVLAAGLWDKNSKFEDISRDYFNAAFGEYGPDVEAYMNKLTELFDYEFMRNRHHEAHATAVERMNAIDVLVEEFKKSHIIPNRGVTDSWDYLWYHADYCHMYTELIRAYESCDEAAIEKQLSAFTKFHFDMEEYTHPVFDNSHFEWVFRHRMKVLFKKIKKTVDFVD